MSRQSSSDPLPYVQLDRASKPKAALLASLLGVTTQHAVGSMVEWWDLCGDPRELEAIVAQTPEGERPAVILSADDVALRFRLASGKDIEPVALVRLGLLEVKPGGFRVRGMSRYFAPIERRLQARRAAVNGGKARAGAPRVGGRFAAPTVPEAAGAPAGGSAGVTPPAHQPTHQPLTSRPPADAPADHQPGTSPSGQRSAVSDVVKKLAGDERPPLQLDPPPAQGKKPPTRSPSDELVEDFAAAGLGKYGWNGAKDGEALIWLKAQADMPEIRRRWRLGLAGEGWKQVRTVAELRTKWNTFAGEPTRKPSEPSKWTGTGPITATEVTL